MKFVTSFEKNGIKKGKAEGKAEGLREATLKILEKRFGSVPEDVALALGATADLAKLEQLTLGAAVEPSIEALRAML